MKIHPHLTQMEASGVHAECEIRSLLVLLTTTPPGCGPRPCLTLGPKLVHRNKWVVRRGYFCFPLHTTYFLAKDHCTCFILFLECPGPPTQPPTLCTLHDALLGKPQNPALLSPVFPKSTLQPWMHLVCAVSIPF